MVWQAAVFSVLLLVGLAFLCIENSRVIKRARRDFDQHVDQFQQQLQKEANEIIDNLPDPEP